MIYRNPTVYLGLLFVALAISFLLASINFSRGHYIFDDELGKVQGAHESISTYRKMGSSIWLNQIPDGDMPIGSIPVSIQKKLRLNELDTWGHPYRLVKNSDGEQMTIGVYSTGEDGVSRTNGDDPDDLISWDPDTEDYYLRNVEREQNWVWLGKTLVLFIILGPLLMLMYKRDSSRRRFQAGRCGACGYDLRGCDLRVCPECGHADSSRSA